MFKKLENWKRYWNSSGILSVRKSGNHVKLGSGEGVKVERKVLSISAVDLPHTLCALDKYKL